MRKIILPVIVLSAASLSGCATIVNGRYQQVSVNTKPPGAHCVLTNNKGHWTVQHTPKVVNLHRSMERLHITCQKPGYKTKVITVKSRTKKMMAGNLLFGGVIGAGVDAGDGAAFSYPNLITVPLRASVSRHHRHKVSAHKSAK